MAKIVSVETFSTEFITIVRLRTDDGQEGYGQVATYHADITAKIVHRQMAPYVLGADPDDIEQIAQRSIIGEHKFPGSYTCRALSGVDTALWDMRGKREGKSVSALLGSTKKSMFVYGSSMSRVITPEDEAERMVRLREEYGFQGFKIRVGSKFGNDVDAWPGRTEAVVSTVRNALGYDTTLLVDANSGFTPKRAIEVGRMLEQHQIGHFEEPCPYPELEWTAEVAAALTIPVSGGEQDCDLAQFRRMIRMKCVDIVQPDICYVGGLTRALQVARYAEEAGLPCTPHNANRSMISVFTLHFQSAIPNAGPLMEFSIEPAPWLEGLFASDPFRVVDGYIAIPDGPGWGVEISKDWLEAADYAMTAL